MYGGTYEAANVGAVDMRRVSWAPIWGCKIADLRTGPGRRDTVDTAPETARTTRRSCGALPALPPAAADAVCDQCGYWPNSENFRSVK